MGYQRVARQFLLDSLGKKSSTQQALRAAVFQASRIIESRYSDPPSAKELANATGLSLSHFHMAFQLVVGESVAQHILRVRLEYSASLLKESGFQLGEIGGACGFQTPASYSRAFKRLYGLSPKEFREAKAVRPYLRGSLKSKPGVPWSAAEFPVPTVRIESWDEIELICLRFYGGLTEVHKPWSELVKWSKSKLADLEQARFFGIWFDSYSELPDPGPKFRYECCVMPAGPIPKDLPEPFFVRSLPAGAMAVTHAQGRMLQLDRTWRSFHQAWLPFSGFQPRLLMGIDEYSPKFILKSGLVKLLLLFSGKTSLKLCLPIQNEPFDFR